MRAAAGGIYAAFVCACGLGFAGAATSPCEAQENAQPQQRAPQDQLRAVQDNLKQSAEDQQKLQAEVESLRTDRARLNDALIQTTVRVQSQERQIADAQARLDSSTDNEHSIRASLNGRRAAIAEVLAALQRMGRQPPPAVLVSPQDMLEAVRTSMLLGAIVPQLRQETEALAADLDDLITLRKSIAAQRDDLSKSVDALKHEQDRLSALVAARQDSLGDAQARLDAEARHSRELAQQATDLKDLITSMAANSANADAARQAEARRLAALPNGGNTGAPSSPFKDTGRLAPAIAFADAKGLLPLPAAGSIVKTFGDADGFGGTERGLSLETRPQAIVSSPSDGWIEYSGPYRTYGQLLIINPGGGYYIVLAGMERINVEVGQFVLAGEPVATMGDGSAKTAASIAIGAAGPILYVEFRREGAAIDPSPWWASSMIEKVRG